MMPSCSRSTLPDMNSVIQKLWQWTRQENRGAEQQNANPNPIAYRICGWPELHESMRTAAVYRLLSTMSVRAVSRPWMLWKSELPSELVDRLLETLQQQGMLQVTALHGAQAHAGMELARREAQVA